MNFLQENYKMLDEAMKMRHDLKAGKISFENYMAQMGGMAQIGKMMDRQLRMMVFELKNKRSLRNIGKDMLGYDPESEKIDCPEMIKKIKRSECLDYAGSHNKECSGCEHKATTQNLLMGTPNAE